ncbi:MAG: hypothetical protein ACO3Z6_06135 [Pseudomonadales bacterium]
MASIARKIADPTRAAGRHSRDHRLCRLCEHAANGTQFTVFDAAVFDAAVFDAAVFDAAVFVAPLIRATLELTAGRPARIERLFWSKATQRQPLFRRRTGSTGHTKSTRTTGFRGRD